jgi:hypothetical protein
VISSTSPQQNLVVFSKAMGLWLIPFMMFLYNKVFFMSHALEGQNAQLKKKKKKKSQNQLLIIFFTPPWIEQKL